MWVNTWVMSFLDTLLMENVMLFLFARLSSIEVGGQLQSGKNCQQIGIHCPAQGHLISGLCHGKRV